MKNTNTIIFLFILVIKLNLLVGSQALAQPEITGTSGNLIYKSTLTITGIGFGIKEPASPISWDDFENQIIGQTVANSVPIIGTNWTLIQGKPGTDAIVFDTVQIHSGEKSVRIDWQNESINAFGWSNKGPYNRLYISYWRYQTGSYEQGTNNHKQFYVYGNGNDTLGHSDLPQFINFIPAWGYNWGFMNNQAECGGSTHYSDLSYDSTKDRWNRWEFWIVLNTVNTTDGIVKEWVSGVLKLESSNYKHRCDGQVGQWDDFRLGHMFQGPGSGAPEALKQAWFDDVYIDITQSRVEICSGKTWVNRNHSEIQLPCAWTDNSIQVTINEGSFNPGDTAYLYVVNQDGIANEIGYPVIFGSNNKSDTISPSVISDLSVSDSASSSITLSWTSPGNDNNIGTASQYDIRYGNSAITETNWASATQAEGEPKPKSASSIETFIVTDLFLNTTYYFAIKTADEFLNWSGISNSTVGTTTTEVGIFEEYDKDFKYSGQNYTNPALDFIIFPSLKGKNIEVFSVLGIRLIDTFYKDRIDVSLLNPGIYFIKTDTGFYKFIKL
jgi:hypothetical protein